jgi:hypothetical protein
VSDVLGFREFALRIGCKPGYVTQLRKAGRLVLTEDGKAVQVKASLARIAATADPARQGVADRHAAARGAELDMAAGAGAVPANVAPDAVPGAEADSEAGAVDPEAAAALARDHDLSMRRARAQTEKAEEEALKHRRENLLEEGKLRRWDEIREVIASAVTTLRVGVESLADILAPQLAATSDEDEVRALLAEYIEQQLGELSRSFAELSKEGATE